MKQREQKIDKQLSIQNKKFKELSEAGQSRKDLDEGQDNITEITENFHRTQDWIQQFRFTPGQPQGRKLDTRSLPDAEKLQSQRSELELLQQQTNNAANQHRSNKAASHRGHNTRTHATQNGNRDLNIQPTPTNPFGVQNLHKLGLVAERDLPGPNGPPLPQNKNKTE